MGGKACTSLQATTENQQPMEQLRSTHAGEDGTRAECMQDEGRAERMVDQTRKGSGPKDPALVIFYHTPGLNFPNISKYEAAQMLVSKIASGSPISCIAAAVHGDKFPLASRDCAVSFSVQDAALAILALLHHNAHCVTVHYSG